MEYVVTYHTVCLHVFNMAGWLKSSEIITSHDVKIVFLFLTARCAVWLTTGKTYVIKNTEKRDEIRCSPNKQKVIAGPRRTRLFLRAGWNTFYAWLYSL